MQPRILVADDQADILSALKLLLKREGFECDGHVARGRARIVAREDVDVALVDLNYSRDTTSGEEGVALVEQLHREHPDLPVVVMTAWATVGLAVKAMQNGANDFLEKPWNNQRLTSLLRNQVQLAEARRRGRRLADENAILAGARRHGPRRQLARDAGGRADGAPGGALRSERADHAASPAPARACSRDSCTTGPIARRSRSSR
jgi:DNA-binding NtrC family response regulator